MIDSCMCVYCYMKKNIAFLFSVLRHTLILIHKNTHIHENKKSEGLQSSPEFTFSFTNINTLARRLFLWEETTE